MGIRLLKLGFLTLAVLIFFTECKQDETKRVDFHYEYFPVEIGTYVTYQVDSTTYDDFFEPPQKTETSKQIKEYIESEYIDNEGRPGVRIERYTRDSSDGAWVISDVWFATRSRGTAERVEENQRYIKLVFPPRNGKTWQGNIFIDAINDLSYLDGWNYELQNVHEVANLNGFSFDSTLTVVQYDDMDDNVIEKLYSVEKYAKHIGMIEKELIVMELSPPTVVGQDWRGREKNGFIVKMEIIDFGVE